MRLTLRTMLAYLDDVLEPADAQELGKKIEESEFASGLVQRLRTSMQRLRLAAPKLEGKGVSLDSNTVAEYLDNTLPPDRVPDFEKVCLEAEVHLAEVAACHQILTLVLGEPADVDAPMRERMYRIGTAAADEGSAASDPPAGAPAATTQPEASGAGASATTEATAEADEAETPKRRKPEVPDYLKSDSKLRVFPIAITLALALLLIGAVVMALGPDTVKNWFTGKSEPAVADADSGLDESEATGTGIAPGDAVGTEGTGPGGGTPLPLRQPPGIAPGTVPGTATTDGAAPGTLTGDGGRAIPVQPPIPPIGDERVVSGDEMTVPGNGPVVPGEADAAETGTAAGNGAVVPGADDTAPGVGELARTDPPVDPLGDETKTPTPPKGEEAVDMGRIVSEQEILIRHDEESGDWHRVPPRDTVVSGNRLMALPTFRPRIVLVNNVQITLDGPTDIRLDPPDESGVPWVNVKYGRLLLMTVGEPGASVGLQMGQRKGVLIIEDGDSTAALEVQPFQQPGSDPEAAPPHIRSNLYATSGSVQWQQPDGAAEVIEAGRLRTFVDTIWAETLDAEEFPKWVARKDISEIDELASDDMKAELTKDDTEVSLRLFELSEHRRLEVRSLAIRCGAYLDHFEPFAGVTGSLNDPKQRPYWARQMDALTESVQRGPETATLVRQTFEKHRSADAENLYRLLWGFSVKNLEEEGWDARLVDYLDSESMDFRVLAIENLSRITERTPYYRAENSAERRKPHTLRWREKLNSGDIRYVNPPAPLPDTIEDAAPAPAASAAAPATVP